MINRKEDFIDQSNKRENEILDFIKKNPGKSKEDIIRYFKTKGDPIGYSRNPMYRMFDKLEEYNQIVIRRNPNNKQTNSIFLNNESLLNSLIEELNFVEKSFSKIIYKITKLKINSSDNFKTDIHLQQDGEVLIFALLDIYKCLIEIYLPKILIEWRQKTNDKTLFDRIYAFFFFKISSLMSKLSSVYLKVMKHVFVNIDNNFINREISFTYPSDIFTFPRLEELLGSVRNLDSKKDLFDLLDFIWPPCYLAKKTRRDRFPESVKDWRDIVPNFNSWMEQK